MCALHLNQITMTTNDLHKLHSIQTTLSSNDFDLIFGSIGSHLWKHYSNNSHNLLTFVRLLDCTNADLLTQYINQQLSKHD